MRRGLLLNPVACAKPDPFARGTDLITMNRIEATLPTFLRRLHTDEFRVAARNERQRRVCWAARAGVRVASAETRLPEPLVADTRRATAIGLRALNAEWGAQFYEVPEDAARSDDAAAVVFGGHGPVVDVQTHFLAPHAVVPSSLEFLFGMYRAVMPDWWSEMDDVIAWSLAEYVRNVFLESETAVAVLTSGPGITDERHLFNHEMSATRTLFDAVAGHGRILNHAVVHADRADEIRLMDEWRDAFQPAGWKVYTLGGRSEQGYTRPWMLDDETHGIPFLERARELDVRLVCAHKGISRLVDNGSPRDVGPAARLFPDIDFVVYHSGYELPIDGAPPEGPYRPDDPMGVDRLLASLDAVNLPGGANVYAELGSTWFCLVSRPVEAAHVLGKLIKRLGADNVLWGTDSIWFGSPQPIIDAFRTFQIPDAMCEEFGYEPLTDEIRSKVLAANAARVYGLDLDDVEALKAAHDRAWARELVDRYQQGRIAAFR
jgi:predicted TIM-barrel fold metal-dependent hydrolase